MQTHQFSAVMTDTSCRDAHDARLLTVIAALNAVDAVMANLERYDMKK